MATAEESRWGSLDSQIRAAVEQQLDGTELLALLYLGIAATPEPELQDFVQFTEADLASGQVARCSAVLKGDIHVVEGVTHQATLLDACRLLRALEQALIECDGYSVPRPRR